MIPDPDFVDFLVDIVEEHKPTWGCTDPPHETRHVVEAILAEIPMQTVTMDKVFVLPPEMVLREPTEPAG